MRLKTIVSPTVSRALEQVNHELGPHALILETLQEGEMTRVVAADVEREEPIEGLMRLRAEIALLRRDLQQQNETVRLLLAERKEREMATQAHASAIQAPPLVAPPSEQAAETTAPAIGALTKPRLLAIERRLRDQGVRDDIVRRALALCAAAPASEGDVLLPHKSEYCMNVVAGLIPGVGPLGTKKARCFVFVGPPGSGKSMTLAKLLQQVKNPDRAGIALVSLDDREKSTALLQRTAQRLRVPHIAARGAEDLVRGLKTLGEPRTILIDTAACGMRERRAIDALRERLPQAGQVAVHLVLKAGRDDSIATTQGPVLAELHPSSLIVTGVDIAARVGCLINLPATLNLPIAAIGHGTALAGDLTIPTRRQIAEIVLGKKLLTHK